MYSIYSFIWILCYPASSSLTSPLLLSMSQCDHVHVLVLVTSLAGPSHYCVLINTSVVVCVLLRVFLFSVFFKKVSVNLTFQGFQVLIYLITEQFGSISPFMSFASEWRQCFWIIFTNSDFWKRSCFLWWNHGCFFFYPLLSEGLKVLSSATEISPDALNLFEVMYQRWWDTQNLCDYISLQTGISLPIFYFWETLPLKDALCTLYCYWLASS